MSVCDIIEALKHLEETASLAERTLGLSHANTGYSLQQLGSCQMKVAVVYNSLKDWGSTE